MTIEELNQAAQKSEKLQREQKQKAGFGQVVFAGAIAAILFRKPIAAILRRMDMSFGSVLIEKFPKIAAFTGAVTDGKIDYTLLKKALGTVRETAPEIADSIFLKSVSKRIDTSSASMMLSALKQRGASEEVIKSIQSVQYGALSLSGFAAYGLASRLVGNKADKDKGYFNYMFTRGMPFFAAGIVASTLAKNDELTGMLKELPFMNRVRESMITVSERLTNIPSYVTSLVKTASELSGRKLGLGYFKEFNRVFDANLAVVKSDSLYDSAIGLRELLGFAKKAAQFKRSKLYDVDQIAEMADSVIKDINERFGDIDSRMYKAMGLEVASIKQLIDADVLDNEAASTLTKFADDFGVDLSKIKAGEGIGIKDGAMRIVDTPRKALIKTAVESTKYFRIPYIFFNPIALMQPRLVKEYMERGVYSVMAGDNVVPTKEGPKRIFEFGVDYINEHFEGIFDKEFIESLPDLKKKELPYVFRLEVLGNKPFLTFDKNRAMDFTENPDVFTYIFGAGVESKRFSLDVSEALGEGYALRKSSIGGSITRAINMQQGMNIPKQATSKWQAWDMPFSNLNNIEDPFFVKMFKKMKSFLGGSEFGGVFGLNKLEKARKLALEGNEWGQHEVASLFRIVSANTMPQEALEELSGMPHTTLQNTLGSLRISSYEDVVKRYHEYMKSRAGLLRSLGESGKPLKVFAPSEMEWHIYKELNALYSSGKKATSSWLEEVVTESGATRMDIIRKSTTFAVLATRADPLQSVEELAKSGKYTDRLIKDLRAVAKYAQAEQYAYSWSSFVKDKRIPLEKIVTPEIIETMHSRVKKSSNFFNSYLKLIGDRVMPENAASKNVYMFVKRSKPFYEMEGNTFREKFWNYLAQSFPSTKDRSSGTLTGILGFYAADRPVQLFEAIGLGRPNYETPSLFTKLLGKLGIENKFQGPNLLGSLEAIVSKRILPVAIGAAAIGYANYKIKEETDIDLKKGLLETSKLALEGAAVVSEDIGLTSFSRYMKESFPGALPMAGATVGYYTSGAFGILFGGGFGALAENIPAAKTVQLEFEGEKSVNVRQGRFWELGNSEFIGGKVVYSRQHLMYLAGTDWQYTDVLWGSEKEYWQHKSYLPTPENRFGIAKLKDPYYFEERNKLMRPYPATGQSDMTDFPIVGNLLQPVSYALKPVKTEETGMPYVATDSAPALETMREVSYGAMKQAVKTSPGFVKLSEREREQEYRSYYLQYPQIKYNPLIESTVRGQLKGSAKDLSDYFGMLGFMANTAVYGDESGEGISTPKIAHSGLAYSRERLYYQMQLGGLFGQSELLRRVITRTQPTYTMDYINPLENRYFSEKFRWLPKDYLIDFYHGDVYRSIGPFGEVRAPGPGYEATHKLYDNYGELDRFLIMSNIAPYATETAVAERTISKKLDQYTPEERYQIKQAMDNMDLQKERYDFNEGAFGKNLVEQDITLGDYLGKGEFSLVNSMGQQTDIRVKLAGVDLDVESVAKKLYETQRDMPIEKAYAIAQQQVSTLEKSFENLIGSTVRARVSEDESERYIFTSTNDIVMPVILGDFNKNLAETYEGTRNVSGHWMNLRAVHGDSTTKRLWESISHLNTFINRKFFGQESAIEKYKRDVVYGKSRKLWEHPIEDFVKPMLYNIANEGPLAAFGYGSYIGVLSGATPVSQVLGGVIGGVTGFGASILTPKNFKPKDTTDRWEMEAKYDAMQGLKEEMHGTRNKSLLGMRTADNVDRASNKLPRIEREFFRSFANAPKDQREDILANTPVYMQDLLKHFWRLKEQSIDAQLSSAELPQQSLNVDWSNYEEYAQPLVEDNINWEGYDKNIDLKKLRTLEAFNRFNDYSKFEIYGSDIRSAMNNLLNTEQIYGNSYQLLSNTINTYYAMKSIGQFNGAGIMGFSVAPQYNGANITFVKR